MPKLATFVCADCQKTFGAWICGMDGTMPADASLYGTDAAGNKVCAACCGIRDRADMLKTGRATLYLSYDHVMSSHAIQLGWNGLQNPRLTNWPGTLRISASAIKVGRHNMAGRRYDVWFRLDGQDWHGTTYGDNTQICHCRRVKS